MRDDIGGDGDGNGSPPPPAVKALRRRHEEAAAWIDALTDPDAVRDVLEEEAALVQRAARRLRALRAAGTADAPPDEWLSIDQVAQLIHRSRSWIRHMPPETIPGRRQHKAGGRVEWSRRAVEAWLATYAAGA